MTNQINHLITYYEAKGAVALEMILDLYSPAALQQLADALGSDGSSIDAIKQAVIARATISKDQVAAAHSAWHTARRNKERRQYDTDRDQWQMLVEAEKTAYAAYYDLNKAHQQQQKELNQ